MTEITRATTSSVGEGSLEEERALTERARTDRDAFALLYRRHVSAVHAYAYRLCGSRDTAAEATSATFERALRGISSFEWRAGGLRPWLFRIASNEVAESYRRQARSVRPRGQMALRELAPYNDGADVFDRVGSNEDVAVLRHAIASIHPRYRDAISLRYLADLSPEEAAAALGCSKAVFAVTVYRALGALRRAMNVSLTSENT